MSGRSHPTVPSGPLSLTMSSSSQGEKTTKRDYQKEKKKDRDVLRVSEKQNKDEKAITKEGEKKWYQGVQIHPKALRERLRSESQGSDSQLR